VFTSAVSCQLTVLFQFIGLDFEMTLGEKWQEVMEIAESLLIFVVHGLQQRDKYKGPLAATKKLHSSAGLLNLCAGGVPRITFGEAKDLLRSQCGMPNADDDENFTFVSSCLFLCLAHADSE
jgi:hypothetical protein